MYNATAWLIDRHIDGGRGSRVAIRCEGESLTYAAVQQQVFRSQHALRALDVRRGERVAMVVNDEPGFVAWFLGGLRSGVVPVPLSTMLTAGDLAAIVDDAGAGVVVVSAEYAAHLPTIAAAAPELRHAVVLGDGHDFGGDIGVPVHAWSSFADMSEAQVAATKEDSPAFWLYSSGTTGVPKGVMHTHGNLGATAVTYGAEVLRIGPDDRCLSVAKLFFAYGLGNSLTFPFAVGATTILNPARPTPPGVAELAAREQPTLFFAAPGFVAGLLDVGVDAAALSSVRLAVTAGESLPGDLAKRYTAHFGHPVLDGIGSTEALHIFVSNLDGDVRPGSTGKPVPGYEVKLLNDADEVVTEPDTPGYLHVRGPSVATGYWARKDASQTAFRGDWLRTGDVYTCSADGYYTFLGRNSDMIKAGGIWVSPAEVESVLIEHPDVLEAAVVGSRDANGLETVVAFVVPRAGHTVSDADLESHCRARMAVFKRPRRVVVVEAFPKTATGKIQRYQLRQSLQQG